MIGIAAGLTIGGKIPFTGTFANSQQEECMTKFVNLSLTLTKNVKICASHAGLTLEKTDNTPNLEDIGLMKMLPGMTVINTCDYNQTKAATLALADHHGPAYLRFGRPVVANFTPADEPFVIGKAIMLSEGTDVTIVATGHLVWEALIAAEALEAKEFLLK
jgi:transketolase